MWLLALPQAKPIQILPICLSSITRTSQKMTLPFSSLIPSGKEVSGSDFRDALVRQIEVWQWPQSLVTSIISALAEAPLTQQQAMSLASKAIRYLGNPLGHEEAPVLVHQLLRFASNTSTQGAVMLGICNRIGEQYCANSNKRPTFLDQAEIYKVSSMKGTILFHIEFAVKQDAKLCTSFLREARCAHAGSNCPFSP